MYNRGGVVVENLGDSEGLVIISDSPYGDEAEFECREELLQ